MPDNQRNYLVGALFLLKLSGNQAMYKNIVAKIDSSKEIVEDQLNNYYNLRIQAINYFQSHHIQIPDMMN